MRRGSWLALALVPPLGYLGAELYLLGGRLGFPLDDSFIHLQFARNLAAGEGLSYNAGELVTGSTAPLWTALLSLAFLLPGEPMAWAKALAIACHLAAVAATWRLARCLALPTGLALLAAGLTASTNWLVWSALAAMEVPLFCALSLLAMARHVEERRTAGLLPLALPLLGLATLLRPEGILLLLLAMVDRLLVFRRHQGALRLLPPPWGELLRGSLLTAIALLPVLLVYRALGDSALPTTFSTKGAGSHPGLPQGRYLFEVLGVLLRVQPVVTLLAPAGALVLLARAGAGWSSTPGPDADQDRARAVEGEAASSRTTDSAPPPPVTSPDAGLLPALWLFALPLAYGVLSGSGRGIFGNFGRYFFPLFPVAAVLAMVPLHALLAGLPRRLAVGRFSFGWPLWVALVLLLPTLLTLAGGVGVYAQNVRNIEDGDVRMAHLLAEVLPAEATLAVDDIGAMKYLLGNRIVDLAGIATPQVHAYGKRALVTTGSLCPGVLAFVRDVRPDYLAIFPAWHPCFEPREFPPLLRLEVEDNITLGDDEIVLHSTPWTRYPLRAMPPGP